MVYVISQSGKALMPTSRHGKVRHLLREGKARVVRREPFTIQLLYDSKEYTQSVTLGVDAGTGHVGLSATTEKTELFASEVTLRHDIQELMSTRREARRTRRFRKTRYRTPRFDNRRRRLACSFRGTVRQFASASHQKGEQHSPDYKDNHRGGTVRYTTAQKSRHTGRTVPAGRTDGVLEHQRICSFP